MLATAWSIRYSESESIMVGVSNRPDSPSFQIFNHYSVVESSDYEIL